MGDTEKLRGTPSPASPPGTLEVPAPAPVPAGPREVDPRLLELIACPLTKTSLDYDPVRQELISRAARLAFPIRDGVPIMITEAARKLDDAELRGGSAGN